MKFYMSDSHAFHKGICSGESHWTDKSGCRPFATAEEMTIQLAENINSKVGVGDILYHLGDWSFGGRDNIRRFREMINCQDIRLCYGNHDHHIRKYDEYKKLFTQVEDILQTRVCGVRTLCCHYAMRVWDKSHHGTYMLYGHSHGTLPSFGLSMDVGVDTNNLFPYAEEEIHSIMQNRTKEIVDHHGNSNDYR